jgi:hypothetical protein
MKAYRAYPYVQFFHHGYVIFHFLLTALHTYLQLSELLSITLMLVKMLEINASGLCKTLMDGLCFIFMLTVRYLQPEN